jgi:catechol 2,3-dioxygenase-like lactoylglutathione lyase family enzyme
MPIIKPYISLVTIGVSDLQKSLAFYSEVLGLPNEGIQGDVVFFKLNGTWLSLYERKNLAVDAGVGVEQLQGAGITLAHNVATMQEVDEVFAALEKAGVKITQQPVKKEWGGYSGYFSDPDGYLWEVCFNPFSPEMVRE